MEVLALERKLTELDHFRLTKMLQREALDGTASFQAAELERIIDSAELVPSHEVSPDIVTMYSQVVLADLRTGRQVKLTLCYPSDAEPAAGFVSVFSPVGPSLLGVHVGSTARWRTPIGTAEAAEVLAILFQPEASGDYTM